eukprot:GHVS01098152.1.p1 GENE.GHVS01098152.1~~GHVS01098152.1.p1  ORF type:complete len:118 (-),score=7.41 GHVS01098152.1:565-918(-)
MAEGLTTTKSSAGCQRSRRSYPGALYSNLQQHGRSLSSPAPSGEKLLQLQQTTEKWNSPLENSVAMATPTGYSSPGSGDSICRHLRQEIQFHRGDSKSEARQGRRASTSSFTWTVER